MLTKKEMRRFVELADKIRFPAQEPIFFAWCRNFYANATELAIVRTVNNKSEILLHLRPDNDPYYPGMWHMPGSVCLPRKTLSQTAMGCLKKEVSAKLAKTIVIPETFLKHWDNTSGARGHTNQFLYLIELSAEESEKTRGGKFFSFDKLPVPIVESHIRMIKWLRNYLGE